MLVLAIVHSVLGERLIFRRVRTGTPGHDAATALLPQRRWDSIWSTWHFLSLIGLGLSAAMIAASTYDELIKAVEIVAIILAATFAVSGVFWFFGTKGKHPAWIVLFVIAALIFAAK